MKEETEVPKIVESSEETNATNTIEPPTPPRASSVQSETEVTDSILVVTSEGEGEFTLHSPVTENVPK